ncbi:Tripartite motif-containing protein 2 [Armadillidium vulgare]|nr:Tripartite motif-containing protein 2 [Armadillidium vulgare]
MTDDVSPVPVGGADGEENVTPSESGLTYTVSDVSENKPEQNGEVKRTSYLGYAEQVSHDYHDINSGPKSLGFLESSTTISKDLEQPLSLGYIRIPQKANNPLAPDKFSTTEGVETDVSRSDKKNERSCGNDFKERSFSFELKKTSNSRPSSRLRSSSLDFRRVGGRRSSSEIANNYLPDSLKDFISLQRSRNEYEDGNGEVDNFSTNSEEDLSKSSDGDCISTTTHNVPSPTAPSDSASSPVIHEPSCKLSPLHNPPSHSKKSFPSRQVSYSFSCSHSSPISKPGSRSVAHNGGNAHACPVHGGNPHSNDSKIAAHSPSPVNHARKHPILSSLSSSVIVPRSSSVDNQNLYCGICTKRYKKPKVLPCLHTFCEQCLIDYTPSESLTLTCPMCKQQSIMPKDGISGLQVNKKLQSKTERKNQNSCSACGAKSTKSCLQCEIILCSNCAIDHEQDSGSDCHSVVSLEDCSSHLSSAGQLSDETSLFCLSHAGQTLRFYCRNCETAVCSSCTDIEHRDHTTMRLNDAVDNQKLDLQRLIDKVNVQLPCMKEALCKLSEAATQLEVNKKKSEKDLRSCFRDLHDLLDERQTELLNRLNNLVTVKRNTIETQREELNRWVSGVEDCCGYVEKSLSDLPPTEVVLMKKQLAEKLLDYVEVEFPPIPRENAHIEFASGDMDALKNDVIGRIGRIQTNSAVPQQTTAIGEALKRISVGRQNVLTIVTRDHKGARIKAGGADVKASISKVTVSKNGHNNGATNGEAKISPVSKKPNGSFDVQIIDLHNGSYEVSFTVHSIGTYSLSVFLFGHHISASPFTAEAHMPSNDIMSDGSGSTRPQSHTYKRQTSKSTQATRKSSSNSNPRPASQKSSCSRRTLKEPIEDDLILKIGKKGRGRGEFVNPQGICYSSVKDGRLIVADSNNQCVQVFNLAGECKIKFGVRGRSAGQLQRPTGVAALLNGHYAVADYENRWVSIFEPSGKYVTRIGHGKLLGPKGMCVNRHGHLIVVDNKACCVFIFHPSGKLITKFGNRMLDGYNFAGPHFCSVNSKGDIIITDFHNHCVRVFTSDGIAKFTFGTNGEGNGQFNAPTGIAVDANDNIIVADWGNSRIQVFDSQGSFISFVNTLADPLYGPQGLTLTPEGNIVVADSGNHCFKVYKYLQ